ncbi:uncharacterized protein [Panulirus ornatus]|uniref:uncharacterized protein n=1 Tax=Panulirus ornatus TaxID=150431 RepID=UPI003A89A1C7
MGKNKLNTQNPGKSGNPIYKKAGAGAPRKAKNKVKPVKTSLRKLKIANKEATVSLDEKLGLFREAMKTKVKEPTAEHPVQSSKEKEAPVNMEEAAEKLSKL